MNDPKDFKGEKSLEEWIKVYEKRAGDEVRFQIVWRENIWWAPKYGFFTWLVNFDTKRLVIPKMCGNGKYMRRIIYEMMKVLSDKFGIKEVYLCSRHKPAVYCRVLGGKFHHAEFKQEAYSGRVRPLYFYTVTLEDTKEREYEKKNKS